MDSFFYIYQLLESHGVIPNKKDEASRVWSQYTLEQLINNLSRYTFETFTRDYRDAKIIYSSKTTQNNKKIHRPILGNPRPALVISVEFNF